MRDLICLEVKYIRCCFQNARSYDLDEIPENYFSERFNIMLTADKGYGDARLCLCIYNEPSVENIPEASHYYQCNMSQVNIALTSPLSIALLVRSNCFRNTLITNTKIRHCINKRLSTPAHQNELSFKDLSIIPKRFGVVRRQLILVMLIRCIFLVFGM
jgi:hypothetical protein